MNDVVKQEKLVDKYVQDGKTDEAVGLLFSLIEACAREKNFVKAEALRDRLFEVDSMALNEIIKSAEIIEEEKAESLDQDHMEVWKEFYGSLTTEESNIFFFAMKKSRYEPGEPVFRQGDKNDRLYFIDQGQLKMVYAQRGAEKLIRNLGPGSLAGEDTFFSITVCTTSLVPHSRVKLNSLDRATYEKWEEEQPALASKVKAYSLALKKESDVLREKGLNRRAYRRIKMTGPILFYVLNAAGEPIGKAFKGDMADVSLGGLSFYIKTANRKNALMLLGRRLRVKFDLPGGGGKREVKQVGTITGVINHLFNDYSIHMRFDTPMNKLVLEEIENVPDAERVQTGNKVDRSPQ